MYLNYYGLREPPFELTSNPNYLFFTEQHREALSVLEYGLSSAKAVTVLVGDAGTGKTTLLQAALQSERCRSVRTLFLSNPTLTNSSRRSRLCLTSEQARNSRRRPCSRRWRRYCASAARAEKSPRSWSTRLKVSATSCSRSCGC